MTTTVMMMMTTMMMIISVTSEANDRQPYREGCRSAGGA